MQLCCTIFESDNTVDYEPKFGVKHKSFMQNAKFVVVSSSFREAPFNIKSYCQDLNCASQNN